MIVKKNSVLTQSGIEVKDNYSFGKRNLLIGKNGSGKTRFLKALIEQKKTNPNNKIISLSFPEVYPFYAKPLATDEAECSSIKFTDVFLHNQEFDLVDFFKLSLGDRCRCLQDLLSLLQINSVTWTEKSRKAFDHLNGHLIEFIQRTISFPDKDTIYLQHIDTYGPNRRILKLEQCLIELSPGELLLFYLAMFMYFIETRLSQNDCLVVVVDEPETHLHPQVLLKFVNFLRTSKAIDELWIASHSLFLLPSFEFEEVHILENSRILGKNSESYQKIYDEIVGPENADLFEFLKSMNSWQYYRFILECFHRPKSISDFSLNEPQLKKVLSILGSRNKEEIMLLDYGAGKCRLKECLNSYLEEEALSRRIHYYAYEPHPMDGQDCREDFFTNLKELPEAIRFDVVVLMNVLHEINVLEWESTFDMISSVLREKGIVIFIEVSALKYGEMPFGETGYLILQDEQVKKLLQTSQDLNIRKGDEKSNCWLLGKSDIERVNFESIYAAILDLMKSARKALGLINAQRTRKLEYWDEETKAVVARRYAFLTQQYINAQFAYDILKDVRQRSMRVASDN